MHCIQKRRLQCLAFVLPSLSVSRALEGVLVVICVSGNSSLVYGTVTSPLILLCYLFKAFFLFLSSVKVFESFAMGACDSVQFCLQFVECSKKALSPRAAVFLWETEEC